jgi:hypothetical protein
MCTLSSDEVCFTYTALCPSNQLPIPNTINKAGPRVLLGTMDLDGFCRSIGFTRSTFIGDRVPAAWGCVGPDRYQAINYDAACRWQYGYVVAFGDFINANDIYSGRCFIPDTGPIAQLQNI